MSTEVLCLVKDNGERYMWTYRLGQPLTVIKSLRKYAADPSLSLTWHDAEVLAHRVVKKESQTSLNSSTAPRAQRNGTRHGWA